MVRAFIATLSPTLVRRLIGLLKCESTLSALTPAKVMREIPADEAAHRIATFVAAIGAADPGISPRTLAFALDCAIETVLHDSGEQKVDLVWTGPESSSVSVRRSAAVLLELIDGSRSDLFVVSFAAFGIPDAHAGLRRAAERGVRVFLILESPEDSSGRYRGCSQSPFADLAADGVAFYRWPPERRPPGALLHAKAVVADGQNALITSANLTEHAIDANIEIGLLVRGGSIPHRLREHLESLIEAGDFQVMLTDLRGDG
jgi:phosphatidylserine/phosphatidylglycerophosphate/cardiolipin synthase-like enzyme